MPGIEPGMAVDSKALLFALCRSAEMRALGLDIDRIQRLACSHEQTVAFGAAETDIGADFRQLDVADARAVGGEDVHPVIAVADPADPCPDVTFGVDANAIRESGLAVERRIEQRAWIGKLGAVDIVLPDDVLGIRVVGDAGIADVQLLVVVAEGDAVRFERLVRHLGDLAGLRVDAVHRFLLIRRIRAGVGPLSLIKADRAIAGIGEPDRLVVGMHHDIVRSVELLAVGLLGEHRGRAVVLETHQLCALRRDLPAFGVECVAVAFVGRIAEAFGDVAVVVEVAQLAIVRNVAPHQIASLCIPGRAFRPEAAGVEPLNRGVADLGLEALRIDHDDVGIGITLRFGVAAEVPGQRRGSQHRRCGQRAGRAQQAASIDAAMLRLRSLVERLRQCGHRCFLRLSGWSHCLPDSSWRPSSGGLPDFLQSSLADLLDVFLATVAGIAAVPLISHFRFSLPRVSDAWPGRADRSAWWCVVTLGGLIPNSELFSAGDGGACR